MTEAELSEIEARAAKATPGPMTLGDRGSMGWDFWPEGASPLDWHGIRGMFAQEADARFYAACREDVPRLVAEVRRLRTALETLREHVRLLLLAP